jgi:outer membrane lipoprotein-sorting protein
MSIFDRKPTLRWVAPLAFVAVVGGTTGIVATATADSPLKNISAQDLLVRVQQAKVDNLSGTVVQNADLGLPAIPGMGGSDASLTSLISGSHTLGVWKSGSDKMRLQVQGTNDETDVVVNGKDMWQWSYKDNKATHRTLTAPAGSKQDKKAELPADAPKTPEEAAAKFLSAVGPTTEVKTDGTANVAGIDAYELVLSPKDDSSLIDSVRIAVDGENFLPLRVQVIAGEDAPKTVFQVAYTNISFDQPSASQFEFNPPPGAKVTEVAPKADKQDSKAPTKKELEARKAEHGDLAADTKVVGEGWSTVVVSKVDTKDMAGSSEQLDQVLKALPTVNGKFGSGKLLSATAFSAVLTDDGRIAVGAVAPEKLYDALAK